MTRFFICLTFTFQLLDKLWSQVSSLLPAPRYVPSVFIAHRAQHSHFPLLVDFHRMLLTHAHGLCASQFVHKKKSLRIYTSMHSGGLELNKLTYSRHEDSLLHHQGDRCSWLPFDNFRGVYVCCCAFARWKTACACSFPLVCDAETADRHRPTRDGPSVCNVLF